MRTGYNRFTGEKSDPNKFYVDPALLSCAIVESQQLSACTDELAIMASKICENVINWPKFRYKDPDTKQEIKSYAWWRFLKTGIYSCKADKNPFSYITQAFYSNMLLRLLWLIKQQQKKVEYEKSVLQKLGHHTYSNNISQEEEYD